jgi:sugar/nucleoside kinase (ribokinase family)
MRIICIGSSSKDIFFPTDGGKIIDTPEDITSQKKFVFELGAKYQVDDRFESVGGCATNVSVGISKLGVESGVITKVGDDYLGKWIQDEIGKEGVDKSLIEIENGCSSDLSAIIVDKKSGERTIFFNRDANEKLEVKPENLEKAEWVFVSALNSSEFVKWEDNLDKIIKTCLEKGIKLALNPGQSNIKGNCPKIVEAIKNSQILMVNKDEAVEILSSEKEKYSESELNDEKFLMETLKKMGPEIVTLTDGSRGAWAYDGKTFMHAKSAADNVVETTGAGDAFSSGFISAYLKGKDTKECLCWGIANSKNSLGFYGATGGLLREEEMPEKIKDIEVKEI